MRSTARADRFATLLLSALGLSPSGACGGATTSAPDADVDGGLSNAGGAHGGASGGGSGGQAGSSVGPRFPCTSPQPIGTTGYVECEAGLVHRVARGTCPYAALPSTRPSGDPPYSGDECRQDADCTEQAYGWCGSFQVGWRCMYGCATDDDCPSGAICRCEPGHGTCRPATCTVDADCGSQLCTEYDSQPGCGTRIFGCQTPGDQCRSSAECGYPDFFCVATDQGRRCSPRSCIEGRPFLVAGTARVAARGGGSGWADPRAIDAENLPTRDAAQALGEAWTNVALMEHASIAAFARFTLQLMSLGAPVALIEQSITAMADETRHARLAFALASHFSGREVGPGALDISDALTDATLEEILVGTIREGCIGETIAAMRAAAALDHARSPVVRDTLARIAADETRHAELAWQFVRWAMARHGDAARRIVQRELEMAQTVPVSAVAEPSEADRALLAGGVLPDWLGSAIHNEVIEGVIRVCGCALLGEAERQAQEAA